MIFHITIIYHCQYNVKSKMKQNEIYSSLFRPIRRAETDETDGTMFEDKLKMSFQESQNAEVGLAFPVLEKKNPGCR